MSSVEKQREYYDQYARAARGFHPLASRAHVHRHLLRCRAIGMPVTTIATEAGVSEDTVWRVLREPDGQIRAATARKILAVKLTRPVTAAGLTRRVRALSAMGWAVATIAQTAGVSPETVKAWRRGDVPGAGPTPSAPALVRAYDVLAMRQPQRHTRYERSSVSRVTREAQRHGWAPPLAWDDDTIDDPGAEPQGAGWKPPSVIEQIRDLEALGMTRAQIAEARGVTRDAISMAYARAARQENAA